MTQGVTWPPPVGAPLVAFPWYWDGITHAHVFKNRYPVPSPAKPGTFSQRTAAFLRAGYAGAVAYVDHLFGRLLVALDAAGQRNATVVALVGDHGYHLGEHATWGKHTVFEAATRVPFLLQAPGRRPAARQSAALSELVDLFPTLTALAGAPSPAGVDGRDLSDALWGPPGGGAPPAPPASSAGMALSEFPRCPRNLSAPAPWNATRSETHWPENSSAPRMLGCPHDAAVRLLGCSVRTDAWRYTAWVRWDLMRGAPDFAVPVARELYAHPSGDEELLRGPAGVASRERHNLAGDPAHAATVLRLHRLTARAWAPVPS